MSTYAVSVLALGKVEDAIAELEQCVRLNPDLPLGRRNLGAALVAAGRIPEAIAQYRTLVGLDPQDVNARMQLELLEDRRGREADGL